MTTTAEHPDQMAYELELLRDQLTRLRGAAFILSKVLERVNAAGVPDDVEATGDTAPEAKALSETSDTLRVLSRKLKGANGSARA